jgi:glutamate dehydrogenase
MHTSEDKNTLINKLMTLASDKFPENQSDSLETFVKQYYQRVAPEYLSSYEERDLYGAVISQWNFIQQRKAVKKGQYRPPKLHVYNPNFEQHGWQSTHTVIEVVLDDMPFIVDSVLMALNGMGLGVHIMIYPVLKVRRNSQGELTGVLPPDDPNEEYLSESLVHVEIDRQANPQVLSQVVKTLNRALGDVRVVVEDWQPMQQRVESLLEEMDQWPDKDGEVSEFLRWIADGHFTFLGSRDCHFHEDKGKLELTIDLDSGVGILRKVRKRSKANDETQAQFIEYAERNSYSHQQVLLPSEMNDVSSGEGLEQILVIAKSNVSATVHRAAKMDYISIKRYDAQGKLEGERRFLGLYTSAAYNSNPQVIPVLRHKVTSVMDKAKLPKNGHAAKALLNILETYPRDELFQSSKEDLFTISTGILYLQDHPRVRLFVRKDTYNRFLSCFVFIPQENYNTTLRKQIQQILCESFGSDKVDFDAVLSIFSIMSRAHFVVYTEGDVPDYDLKQIEERIIGVSRSWKDKLREILIEHRGEGQGNVLFQKYAESFPLAYREEFIALTAVFDIQHMQQALEDGGLSMTFYRSLEEPEHHSHFKLFHAGSYIPLSDVLPTLENMGLKVIGEHFYEIVLSDQSVWIHDFSMEHADGLAIHPEQYSDIFQQAFAKIWGGEAENDTFNWLVLGAQFAWRDIAILRAYSRYLRQTGFTLSLDYVAQTLIKHTSISRLLISLFYQRFDPVVHRGPDALDEQGELIAQQRLTLKIDEALNAVANLDEDRILRRYLALMLATIRCNFFQQKDGKFHDYLSFKFDPSRVLGLPKPLPVYEIFVYSPRIEGVHLRGAKVARGGLRWSDRLEDFRTEILGLVKAQQVKNAVIVPGGAKGGFVVKNLPAGREQMQQEVQACYRTFIRGLLDITDNLVEGKVVKPLLVETYDEDDPYLVVAADKGTASFSDIANELSAEYGFWLGDAFASGGSEGYNHKEMGITARGAWESVKHHFRRMGVDTQSEAFTVVAIGDMAGDVFGNGMLLSRTIQLVAAFNHMHIFIDPAPDLEKSFQERDRLFNLPRSSWSDYSADLISAGGGIYARSAKSIDITPEMAKLFDIQVQSLQPNDLIRALLRAPVDLIWNGGIGTYVKSGDQSSEAVADRANDSVRINGAEMRAKVFGEGGNLGFTQLGRIEYGLSGGFLNTDSIDNSGGVDCSDREVNIKILLDDVVKAGDLTQKQRNQLLVEMTPEVSELVLDSNYRQSLAVSMAEYHAGRYPNEYVRLMHSLENQGMLDRELEFLPTDELLQERHRQGQGLARSEISVLLSYSKLWLKSELIDSQLPEDPWCVQVLRDAFPQPLQQRYDSQLQSHKLRREIVVNQISNRLVNDVGMTFVNRLSEEDTDADIEAIVRAYVISREVFGVAALRTSIEALNIDSKLQFLMVLESGRLSYRATRWFLRHRGQWADIKKTTGHFQPGIGELVEHLPRLIEASEQNNLSQFIERMIEGGVPESLSCQVAGLRLMSAGLDIIEVAHSSTFSVDQVASAYFSLGSELELNWLREQLRNQTLENHWQRLAALAYRDDLDLLQRELLARIDAGRGEGSDLCHTIEVWIKKHTAFVDHWKGLLAQFREQETLDFAMYSVALEALRKLVAV